MENRISQYAPPLYAVLRIVAGLLFALHGSQKLFGVPGGGDSVLLFSLLGLAGVVELSCGLLIAIGLFARITAFLASGQMSVAYFMAHLPLGLVPSLNKGETALLFCFVFLYIFGQGAGIWSLDANRRQRPHSITNR